jgi:hypothetical protein
VDVKEELMGRKMDENNDGIVGTKNGWKVGTNGT